MPGKSRLTHTLLFLAVLLWCALPLASQAPTSAPGDGSASSQQPAPPKLPESGPSRRVDETVIVPRQRAPEPPPEPSKVEKLPGIDEPIFRADVELVSLSVVVQNRNGEFLSGLTKDNFRVTEDGVLQTIQRVEAVEAPVTVAMVVEYSSLYWDFLYDTFQAAVGFVYSLKPEDWVALIFYDLRTQIIRDFTRNKAAIADDLRMLQTPGFSEANLFDAVAETVDRMQDIAGKKAIVLVSSGVDTFSKTRYDAVLKKVQASDTPIYAIGTGQAARLWYEGRGYMSSAASIGFLQADNQLRTFARYSGGRAYFPRFHGEFPSIYADIAGALRNEYVLSYSPTNTAHDGKFRKVKVELVDKDGKPLKIIDAKGKEVKYEVRAREGYTAPRAVE
ncbi:MAG TPA: VWA domain-containing protein [Terriglobia bacterium]|nr:VWA domain-containing protein [Terriglobia bacterium]